MIVKPTTKFKKDLKIIKKRGWKLENLREVLETLASGRKLDLRYLDHSLNGELRKFRECHIENDWLLIYQIDKDEVLYLARTGSHSDLF